MNSYLILYKIFFIFFHDTRVVTSQIYRVKYTAQDKYEHWCMDYFTRT
jgi:hypothetical protein